MLERIYIDNFRCFVNFELKLGRQHLILGGNGTGKSTLLQVIQAIRQLLIGEGEPDTLFSDSTRTRWQTRPLQRFELDARLGDESYRLLLEIDSWGDENRRRVKRESVSCDGHTIFDFSDGEVSLFNDRFERKVQYPFDWRRSALATIQPRRETARLNRFKEWIEKLYCLSIDPRSISPQADSEDRRLTATMANFAAWYRHMTQENQGDAAGLRILLGEAIQGLDSLDLREKPRGTSLRTLSARFVEAENPRGGFSLEFNELSDGQRVLVCLYSLLVFLVGSGATLFIDEPENFLALAEIQPWLVALRDRLDEKDGQAILISHHPELINYLAGEMGLVFYREGVGPSRVTAFDPKASPLSPAERIARGW